MQISIGNLLKVSVRHTYVRAGRFYYQRSVPIDLRDRYPAQLIKKNLNTVDPLVAARRAESLDRQHEAEWRVLRGNPEVSAISAKLQAERLLSSLGIDPLDPEEHALSFFTDMLDAKRKAFARGDETAYRETEISAYLDATEVAAVEILKNPGRDRLSDGLIFYLQKHHNKDSASLQKSSRIAMDGLIAAISNKYIDEVSRDDGRLYINTELSRGVTTGTVRRRLKALNAIFNAYIREKGLDWKNHFAKLQISGEGCDEKKREPFTASELMFLQTECMNADDDMRWILAILSDTGARLGEVVGLAVNDFNLDYETPYVDIRPHPWRRLKNSESSRVIPLVGAALWAARRVCLSSKAGQKYAFPRYIKDGVCKAESASPSLNNWMRSRGLEHTCHELRHTLRDRLREVECLEEITDMIGGWHTDGEGASYGKGYRLKIMQKWMKRISEPDSDLPESRR